MGTPADRDQAPGQDGVGGAATQVITCQWQRSYGGRACGLPVDSAHPTLCILHGPAEGKDPGRFQEALRQKLEQEEADDNIQRINLEGVEFLAGAYIWGWEFKKALSFAEARFPRGASFSNAHFDGNVDFLGAHFDGEAYFRGALFDKDVYFWQAHFDGVAYFLGARFDGKADFRGTHFGGEVYFEGALFNKDVYFTSVHFGQGVTFRGTQFGGEADFRGTHFDKQAYFTSAHFYGKASLLAAHFGGAAHFIQTEFPADDSQAVVQFTGLAPESAQRLRFEGADLSRVSFLRTDVSQVHFVDCTWAQASMPILWGLLPLPWPRRRRSVIYDEVALDIERDRRHVESDRRLVAELCRQLRLNYEKSLQEAEAGHFYMGQMEMRRQDPTYPWYYRWLLVVYRVLAMYGESYLRPPFFYILFGAVFALAYLWGGFQVGQFQVKYDPASFAWGQAGGFFQDYVRAYVQALTAGGFVGTNLGGLSGANLESAPWWVPAVRYANMLLDTFLVGFFVIALRRHFHR